MNIPKNNLTRAATKAEALEDGDTGEWVCTYQQLEAVCLELGCRVPPVPDTWRTRQYRLRANNKLGKISVRTAVEKGDTTPPRWIAYKRTYSYTLNASINEQDESWWDELLKGTRATSIRTGTNTTTHESFWLLDERGMMRMNTYLTECRLLGMFNRPRDEIRKILAGILDRRFIVVNIPFGPEYPVSDNPHQRLWNRGAAQLCHKPTKGKHPTWDTLFNHVFGDLNSAVKSNEWCQENGITTGADYGRLWVASVVADPFQHLPYLFLWGEENSGKSTFHEALNVLVTKGVVIADRALTNTNDFNGELADCVFAVVEEKNVALPIARARMTEWVTALQISIRKMHTESYMQRNTLHWIQCSNDVSYAPVWPGDTRVVCLQVDRPAKEIPKYKLMKKLEAEAPAFTHTLINIKIPKPAGRLLLPVLDTESKLDAINKVSPIHEWATQYCELCADARVAKTELYQSYKAWCIDQAEPPGKQATFGKKLVQAYPSIKDAKIDGPTGRVNAYAGITLRLKVAKEAS